MTGSFRHSVIHYVHKHRLHIRRISLAFFFPLADYPCSLYFLFNPLLLTWNPPSCDRIRPPRSQVACKLTPPCPTLSPNSPLPNSQNKITQRLTRTTSRWIRHLLSGTVTTVCPSRNYIIPIVLLQYIVPKWYYNHPIVSLQYSHSGITIFPVLIQQSHGVMYLQSGTTVFTLWYNRIQILAVLLKCWRDSLSVVQVLTSLHVLNDLRVCIYGVEHLLCIFALTRVLKAFRKNPKCRCHTVLPNA